MPCVPLLEGRISSHPDPAYQRQSFAAREARSPAERGWPYYAAHARARPLFAEVASAPQLRPAPSLKATLRSADRPLAQPASLAFGSVTFAVVVVNKDDQGYRRLSRKQDVTQSLSRNQK